MIEFIRILQRKPEVIKPVPGRPSISDKVKLNIRLMLRDGYTSKQIKAKHGVSDSVISGIRKVTLGLRTYNKR